MNCICTESFSVPKYDEHGFMDETKCITVEQGSVWYIDSDCSIIGADIHLENDDTLQWLEISNETFKNNFVMQ